MIQKMEVRLEGNNIHTILDKDQLDTHLLYFAIHLL